MRALKLAAASIGFVVFVTLGVVPVVAQDTGKVRITGSGDVDQTPPKKSG